MAQNHLFDPPADRAELDQAISLAKSECKDAFALTYLNALPDAESMYGREGVSVQLLYCLNNMSTWRGENARATKLIFKKWVVLLAHKPKKGRSSP